MIVIFLQVIAADIFAQKLGCKDPYAKNFLSSNKQDDCECEYRFTRANPVFIVDIPNSINESSALIFLNQKYWTINDSGGENILFALDPITGEIGQQIKVQNAVNTDWEALTMDEEFLYVGDFGNNLGNRKDLTIYKVRLEDIPAEGNGNVVAEKITFAYPTQKNFESGFRHNFDCEAFIVKDNSIFLFTKNWENHQTDLYQLPTDAGNYEANFIDSFDVNGLITAAAISNDQDKIVLLGYQNYVPFIWLIFDFHDIIFFEGNKRRIDFPNMATMQTEGICFVESDKIAISSEKTPTFSGRLMRLNTSPWLEHPGMNGSLKTFKKTDFEVIEDQLNPTIATVSVHSKRNGNFRLDVTESTGKVLYSTLICITRNAKKDFQMKLLELRPGTYVISLLNKKRIISKTTSIQ